MDTAQVAKATPLTSPLSTASPEGEGASSLTSWLAVLSVAAASFAFVGTEYLPVGLLPQIARDLSVTPGTAGLMVTTPGVIAAFSAPALLLVAGRVNRRLILLTLSVLLLASNLVSSFAHSFEVMLVGRALLGLSLGGFWTVALGTSGQLVRPERAARASAMIFMGITLATVIGVPLGTLIANLSSWRVSFLATAILAAVALAAQAVLLPSLPAGEAIRLRDLGSILTRMNPAKSFLMVALVFGAHFSSYTYIAPFLVQSAGFSLQAVTLVLLGFGIVGFVANFVVSAAVTNHVKGSLSAMVALVMVVLFALPVLHASHTAVFLIVMAWGVAYGAIPLCLSIWTQLASPDKPEAASALFVSTVQAAIAVGSSMGGVVVDNLGIPATMRLGAVLAIAGLAVILSFRTHRRTLAELLAKH